MSRRYHPINRIVAHWRETWPDAFPDIQASLIGWGEPFCFRCGWLAPTPGYGIPDAWAVARSWLQRAHLQDHFGGGSDEPENIIPLCHLCHMAMPDFPDDPAPAIAWVRAGQPISCFYRWQMATDDMWGFENFRTCPGSRAILRLNLQIQQKDGSSSRAPV